MLVACVTLLLGVTACSSEEFGMEVPEASRMIETRANEPLPVYMRTFKKDVRIRCLATENVIIHWGGEGTTKIVAGDYSEHRHTFSTEEPYNINIEASKDAIIQLEVSNNDLTHLNVENNINLEILGCNNNGLPALNLTGCPNLKIINAMSNKLSNIDLTQLHDLEELRINSNKFTQSIDLSQNLKLHTLQLEHSNISSLDISKNTQLQYLYVGGNSITSLDLTNNTDLRAVNLYDLPIYTINNKRICETSFSSLTQLERLNIHNTPFYALDLSKNNKIHELFISETDIDYLDLTGVFINYFYANDSKLNTLVCTPECLSDCAFFAIYNTPFEERDSTYLIDFIANNIPDRFDPLKDGTIVTGIIMTNSSAIKSTQGRLDLLNWIVL